MLLFSGSEILRADIDYAVGINVEGNFDLRNAATRRCDTVEMESAKRFVVLCHLALALENIDFNRCLIVCSCGEDLALLGRNGCVAVYKLRAYAAKRLDSERQRRYVEKEYSFNISAENAALDSCSDSDALIRVDALESLFAEDALYHILNRGDTCRAADEKDLADIGRCKSGIRKRLLYRTCRLLDKVMGQLIELCSRERYIHMLRACCVCRDIRQIDIRCGYAAEFYFGLLGSFLESLHGYFIAGEIDSVCFSKLIDEVFSNARVKVIAAEAVISSRRQNLYYSVTYLENGYIKSTAAEVVDHYLLVLLLIEPVGKGSSCRLVYDTLYIESCDTAGVLCRLALSVRKVCGDCDDSFRNCLSEECLCVCLHLLKDHCRDLLRSICLVVDGDLIVGSHLALDGGNGPVGICNCLAFCHLSDHSLSGLGKCYD